MSTYDDDSTKVLLGFIAGFAAIVLLGSKGCSEYTKTSGQQHAVQMECLKSNGPLECKELP